MLSLLNVKLANEVDGENALQGGWQEKLVFSMVDVDRLVNKNTDTQHTRPTRVF